MVLNRACNAIMKGEGDRPFACLLPGAESRELRASSALSLLGTNLYQLPTSTHTYRGLIRASIVCVEVDKQFFVCSIVVYYE